MSDAIPAPERLTAEMKAIMERQSSLSADTPTRSLDDFEGMRADYIQERSYWNEGGAEMAAIVNASVDGVKVRYYYPSDDKKAPAIVYIHGGGWIIGNLDTHDRIMRTLAEKTQSIVIGVDYSLSPEAKFPRPLEECVAVMEHCYEHASELRLDPDRISLAGDSAGAYFALASSLYLADHRKTKIKLKSLLLFYGLYGLKDSASRRLLGGAWDGMARADLDFYWDSYLQSKADFDSPYVDCLSADLSLLPPCYIAASELDPVKDDSYALANLLERAGITYKLTTFKGVLHGFLHYSRALTEARAAFAEATDFYKTNIKN